MKNSIKKIPLFMVTAAMLGGCGGNPNPAAATYNVKFMNGTTLFNEQNIEEGKTVTKPSTNPTKAEDTAPQQDGKYYSYSFDKWVLGDKEYDFASPITKDIVLDATYTKEVVKHTVKFVCGEETLYSASFDKGGLAEFKGTEPTKAADDINKSYSFAGWKNNDTVWNLASDKVMGDVTLTAYFDAVPRQDLVVSLVDSDGVTPLGSINVKEGLTATKPADPTKAPDAQFTYEFKSWMLGESEFDWATPVSENITLKASWKSTVRKYEIKFLNDEDVIDSQELEYGSPIVPPADDLSYEKDGYSYTHLGWTLADPIAKIEDFGTVTGNKTYYSLFDDGEVITYTATVKFDYAGGASDKTIDFTVENREEKLSEIEALLPDNDDDNIFYWEEELPDVLPLEDCEFSILANCKYYSVDMSDSDINENINFVNRSGAGSLVIEDEKMKFNSTNDVFFSTRSYTNFDLEFNLTKPVDQFSLVVGANEDNMNKNYGEGAPGNATNGTAFIVVKPTHASARIRPYGKGAQIESCPNNPAIPQLSSSEPVKIKFHFEDNYFEVYLNDQLEVAREFAADAYTPGGYIGIFAPSGTMEFTSFGISKVIPTDEFETDFSNNIMPRGLVFNGRSGETYSIKNGVLTTSVMNNGLMYTKASLEELTVEFEIKLNGRFAVEIGAKDTNKGYGDGSSSITNKYVGFYFMNNNIFFIDNDKDRVGKDGGGIQSFATSVAFDGNSFVKVKIDFHNNKFNISLNNTAVITNVSPTNEVTAGHFVIARASTGAEMNFDSFSLKY